MTVQSPSYYIIPITLTIGEQSGGEGSNNDQHNEKEESGKNADSAEKLPELSREKQNRKSHSHSGSGGPHSHSGSGGYGGPLPHGSMAAAMMPNGFVDPPMSGYPPPHPAVYPHHPPYPHHSHMDPVSGMEYRNGLGGPAPPYPPGFYPPHHQRMPYYPGPPHSGGLPPYSSYQIPPHHPHPHTQGELKA